MAHAMTGFACIYCARRNSSLFSEDEDKGMSHSRCMALHVEFGDGQEGIKVEIKILKTCVMKSEKTSGGGQ
jgi:hypothetical protein